MTALLPVAILAFALAGVAVAARLRWRQATSARIARLGHGAPPRPRPFARSDLDGMPAPVRRYLDTVLRDGQPHVSGARVSQAGDFLVDPEHGAWRPFTAVQHFATRPPGFVWDARIRVLPGMAVHVRDAFVNGTGSMHASLMGLRRLALAEGTPGIAAGALHRYLAEAVLFPTALLPGGGMAWVPVDEATARATLSAGSVEVALDFRFGPDGLVESVFTPARSRDVGGRGVPTPWQGRWTAYEERGGLCVPTRGEVEWILSTGPQVYWRGRILDVAYDV